MLRPYCVPTSQPVYNDMVERQTTQSPPPPARTVGGRAPNGPTTLSFEVAPLDDYALRITNGLAYMGGLLMLPLLFAYLANLRWEGLLVPVGLALAVALFLLLSYGAQPRRYELTERELLVRRRFWRPLRVPFGIITGASPATPLSDVPTRQVRFAFNPGVFGYQGPFLLAPYGEVFFLATNRARLVAVARAERTSLILSPARPRDFVEALNQLRTTHALEALEPQAAHPVIHRSGAERAEEAPRRMSASVSSAPLR